MLDIKIIKSKKDNNERYLIEVNGLSSSKSYVYDSEEKEAYVYDRITENELLAYSPNEISKFLNNVHTFHNYNFWEFNIEFNFFCLSNLQYKWHSKEFTGPYILVNINFETENWAKPWSLYQFSKKFKNVCIEINNPKIVFFSDDEDDDSSAFPLNGIGFYYFIDSNANLAKEFEIVQDYLKFLIKETNKQLLEETDIESVIAVFDFPLDTKSICKQYLIYFAQFIADLGFNIDTEIKEEANNTLFKIIPKDKDIALEQIRKALDIYLNLPTREEINELNSSADIAAKQWAANILHLQSQLMLSESIIKAKNVTIDNLNLALYQQNQKPETIIIQASDKTKDEENILWNLVSVGNLNIEKVGIRVYFPELIRRLKRKFSK